jgi:hypothetical protein
VSRTRQSLLVLSPILLASVTFALVTILEALGASCTGDALDGRVECNSLGDARQAIFWGGYSFAVMLLVVVVLGVTVIGLRAAARRLLRRSRAPSSTP